MDSFLQVLKGGKPRIMTILLIP